MAQRGSACNVWQNRAVQSVARVLLALALVVMLVAPAIDAPSASAAFVFASLLVPGALLASSAPAGRAPGGRFVAALVLTILLEIGAAALLAGPGYPPSVWIMLGLLGLGPLVVVPAIHALRARGGAERP